MQPARVTAFVEWPAEIDVRPVQKAQLLLTKPGVEKSREDCPLEVIRGFEQPFDFVSAVGWRFTSSFGSGVLEELVTSARICQREAALVNQKVEEGAQYADLEIDGPGCDRAALVLFARFLPAGRLEVVDIGAGDRFDELFPSEDPLEVLEYLSVTFDCLGLVGGMDLDVVREHPDRVGNRRDRQRVIPREGCLAVFDELADQLVDFAALSLDGFARSPTGELPSSSSAVAPVEEVVARPLVPDVAHADPIESR